ncbi:hypothetical protein J2X36_004503 [Methylobacterium sp. BE186]|uniref:DUF6894 family protein n=1 Tax=Methylobacterium sp. BE186 TaxID=2817715 RepID=UPI00285B5F6B|nr:hypothetical protein [Methylobacterium sp. BE186]
MVDMGLNGLKAPGSAGSRREHRVPRYFFDTHDGHTLQDNEGLVLSDLSRARAEVQRVLCEMVARESSHTNAIQIRVDVRDESGKRVLTATLLAVIEEPPKR